MKGFNKFREKTPWFAGNRIFLLPPYFLIIMTASILILIFFHSLSGMTTAAGSSAAAAFLFPLLGEVLIAAIGLFMVSRMWAYRVRFRARYGQLSYQRMVLVGFGGIILLVSLAINLFLHYWKYSPTFWSASPLQFLAIPLEAYAGGAAPVILWIRMIVAVFLLVTGIMMIIRSLQTFGFDYMTVVYLYFPEESRMQDHEIYSVLRHPTYAAALTLGLAGVFYIFTVYSVVFFLVFLAAFYFHIHFVEEKELIQRFGQSYRDYMKKVPAFTVKPGKLGVFFRFLLKAPAAGAD